MSNLFHLSIFTTLSILASTLPTVALSADRVERLQATCEFLNKSTNQYIRDSRCFIDIHHTPIIPTAIDFYWADGVITHTTITSVELEFVGFAESPATIDGEAGRFLTTGATAMNCFEVDATKNRICYEKGWDH